MTRPKGPAQTLPEPARIWGLLASNASTAVLFRRGPSRSTRLYLWNTHTDTITPGSWFAGRLYEWMSDLSPDGKHLIYVARNEAQRRIQAAQESLGDDFMVTWTAICRPPWVRALGLWNASDGWSGGGIFTDNRTVHLNHCAKGLKALIEPTGFTIQGLKTRERSDVVLTTMGRTGWKVKAVPERWGGMGEAHPIILRKGKLEVRFISSPRYRRYVRYRWLGPEAVPELDRATWADIDQQGRLVMATAGRLYAVQGTKVQELMDLNLDQPPRPVPIAPATTAGQGS